jgi:hypothetical protein
MSYRQSKKEDDRTGRISVPMTVASHRRTRTHRAYMPVPVSL